MYLIENYVNLTEQHDINIIFESSPPAVDLHGEEVQGLEQEQSAEGLRQGEE